MSSERAGVPTIPIELTWLQWAEVVGSLRGDATGPTAVIADLIELQVFALYADYPQRFVMPDADNA